MGNSIGWAWWHHRQRYARQFNEPVPQWLHELDIGPRVRLIRLATALAWRLPAELLPDDTVEQRPASKRQ